MALTEIAIWSVHVRRWMITGRRGLGQSSLLHFFFTLHNVTYRRYLYARRATNNNQMSVKTKAQSPSRSLGEG